VSAVDPAFQRLLGAYRAKLSGLGSRDCQLRPVRDVAAWSTQDVVEHLVLTYRGSVAQVEKYLHRGAPTSRRAGWKQVAARTLVIDLRYFPRGQMAPEFVLPGQCGLPEMDGNALADLLEEELNLLDTELVRCEQVFGSRAFASHFRFGPLSAGRWRRFHIVHGKLHLAQLAEIEKQIARTTPSQRTDASSVKAEIPGDGLRSQEDRIDRRHAEK
jgi:hypothetical protein